MSDISPINTGRVARPDRTQSDASRPVESRGDDPRAYTPRNNNDRVEISSGASLLSKLRAEPGVREDLVARVKEEIANGTYETESKLETAIDLIKEDLELELNLDN